MLAEAILAAARAAIGTPFRHQGRAPGAALDCAGLAVHAAQEAGLTVTDLVGYADRPRGGALEAALDAQPCLQRIPVPDARAGDLLLMKFSGDPQHLAIHGGDTIIHAYAQVGKTCEHDWTPEWRSRVVRAYRFVEVA